MNKNFQKKTAYDYVQQTKKGLEAFYSKSFLYNFLFTAEFKDVKNFCLSVFYLCVKTIRII